MPTTLPLSDPTQTAADLDGVLPTDGGLVLFENVPEPDVVVACDALATRRGLRLHRVGARDLVQEKFDATQGNLREAFDEARGQAVFLLTDADALLDAHPRRGDDEPEEPPPQERLRRYLVDRIEAFDGVVALCVGRASADLDALRTRAVVVTA